MLDNTFINKKGFVAALDQSGGSIKKALTAYGIKEYNDNMFSLIHEMRIRVLNNIDYSKIIGVIFFEDEVKEKINDKNIINFLLDKNIVSFVKIDKGLCEKDLGVCLMNNIPNLEKTLNYLKENNVYGTKMRSVIYENNELGIKNLVKQQFDIAKIILKHGLIPIIEPEVDINSKEKEECEKTLKKEIIKNLNTLGDNKIILKLTIPSTDNFYEDYTNDKNILKVLALSGGYNKKTACEKLSRNKGVIASFSRALLEGLNINQNDNDFKKNLDKNTLDIYKASVKKE